MKLGMVGPGKMEAGMARRLLEAAMRNQFGGHDLMRVERAE